MLINVPDFGIEFRPRPWARARPEVLPYSMMAHNRHLARARFAGLIFAFLALALPPGAARGARVAPGPPSYEPPEPGVVRSEEFSPPPAPPAPPAGRVRGFHGSTPPVEEVYVFQDSLDGRSIKDEAGWTHYDNSEKPVAWHLDTVLGCQGKSWWCGRVDSTWTFDSNRAGYDNDWVEYLWNSVRIDSVLPGTPVTIAFRDHFSAEPDYDYGFVEVLDPFDSWTPILTLTGDQPRNGGCESLSVAVPDSILTNLRANADTSGVKLFFRFTFTSDLSYSSADGLYNGDGWVIDNITLKAGTSRVLFFDNCENGMGSWQRSVYPGVGDYWQKASNVQTEDQCTVNRTQIWVDWDPLLLSLVPRLDNWLVTPPVGINRANEAFVMFDVYRNLPLQNCFYYHFRFRTKNVGDAAWGTWLDPTRLIYYGGQKDWVRQRVTLAGAGNHDSLQVRFGLRDFGQTYCGGTASGANTYAHFDNVAIGIIQSAPPKFVGRDLDLLQDTFSTTAFMGRDDNFNTPLGDSAVVQVNVSRGYKQGFFTYHLNGGSWSSVPLQVSAAALPSFRYGDVPPGNYPANTTLEYYFSVTDSTDATSYLPADAPNSHIYFSASVLPVKTVTNAALGCTDSLAHILFVNHNAGRETDPAVASALRAWGYKFDTWEVNGPSSGAGNCIGGSDLAEGIYYWPATDVSKLLQYSTIVWHSGSLNAFTISRQDQAVLQSWIQQPGRDRNFWITGDNIAYEVGYTGVQYNSFLDYTCGVQFLRDLWENFPQDTLHPAVSGVAGSPSAGRFFHVNADCPQIDRFDLITTTPNAAIFGKPGPLLRYPNSLMAASRFARKYTGFGNDSARVVFMAFSFNDIEEGGERLQLAKAITTGYFKETACFYASGVPEDTPGESVPGFRDALEQNAPNPFNPQTAIGYSVSRGGGVEIRVYNVAGALVRRIDQRVASAGRYVAHWDGTDDSGRRLASGVYFYEIQTESGFRASRKLLMLK